MNKDEQILSLTRELDLMRERYLRLINIHGEIQQQNSLLEERILSIVETYSDEKTQLEQDLINAKQQIIHLQDTVEELEIEKQRYKDDCNLAVNLLHQRPEQFIPMKPKNENNESISMQSSHSLVMPTFPPTFVTSFPLVNTTNSSSEVQQTSIDNNLRLAESLFKSNSIHRYPSTHFLCSNCHRTVKCYDVSVQTNSDQHSSITRTDILSRYSIEPHHIHMTVQEYQMGNTKRLSQDVGLPSNSIPQMHQV